MYITGIGHPPERLHERKPTPSVELVYLAKRALLEYQATHVITSLALGWEQALAKGAQELKIPYTVAIPYPGREKEWEREVQIYYLDLIGRAKEVYRVADHAYEQALMDGHRWRVDRADLTLALWDYTFEGMTYEVTRYALCSGKQVFTLWREWERLYRLRRQPSVVAPANQRRGAQVYDSRR